MTRMWRLVKPWKRTERTETPGPAAEPEWRIPPDPFDTFYQLVMAYLLACGLGCILGSCLLWNWTASLPLGLYGLVRGPSSQRGDVVAFGIPEGVRQLVHDRGYLPDRSLIVKPIVAKVGDYVCVTDGVLSINGARFGAILIRDREGRDLPQDGFCGVLPRELVYVASSIPGSFDSRTFGPIRVADVHARVVPLWTY